MASLVQELQRLASSSTSALPELLRKAKLVAFKLGLDDFQKWIDFELEGYKDIKDIPLYRIVHCELRADEAHFVPITDRKVCERS